MFTSHIDETDHIESASELSGDNSALQVILLGMEEPKRDDSLLDSSGLMLYKSHQHMGLSCLPPAWPAKALSTRGSRDSSLLQSSLKDIVMSMVLSGRADLEDSPKLILPAPTMRTLNFPVDDILATLRVFYPHDGYRVQADEQSRTRTTRRKLFGDVDF